MLLTVSGETFAQKESNIWEFGDSLGIDFNSVTPTLLLDGVLNFSGSFNPAMPGFGDVSIADRHTGKLLFYGVGHRGIFNRKHQLMATHQDSADAETAVIVPMGCDTNKYIVCDNDDGWVTDYGHGQTFVTTPTMIAYSIIDMSLDGGNGGMADKPTVLLRGCSDRVTAIPHTNGTDSWIIGHALHSKYYFAWHVSARGVNSTPVLSVCDTSSGYVDASIEDEGNINTSPDGRWIVDMDLNGKTELLRFDASNGSVTYDRTFSFYRAVSACFSPNSSKLYLTNGGSITQYDLQTRTFTKLDSAQTTTWYSLQLGPDGKVYTCGARVSWLGVISNPNIMGVGCNYQPYGFYLGGRKTSYDGGWLPTNMNSYPTRIPDACNRVTADFTVSPSCNGRCVTFSDWSNGSPANWKWSFPGAQPSADSGQNVSVCYDSAGFYPVTLVVTGPNGSDTLIKSVVIESGSRETRSLPVTVFGGAGSTVLIPIRAFVPASLRVDTVSAISFDVSLAFNPSALGITTANLQSRITPPNGWESRAPQIQPGSLTLHFYNTNKLSMADTLDLGSVLFDVIGNQLRTSLVTLESAVIHTAYDELDLCTNSEGEYLAKVVDSTAGIVETANGSSLLTLFPVPVHGDVVHVMCSKPVSSSGRLSLIDVLGTTRWQSSVTRNSILDIPLARTLANGTYYVRLSTPTFTTTKRFVVTR